MGSHSKNLNSAMPESDDSPPDCALALFAVGFASSANSFAARASFALAMMLDWLAPDSSSNANSSTLVLPELFLITLISVCPVVSAVYVDWPCWI